MDVIEEGPIALGLRGYADAVRADLFVMTTHGSGPMSRFWLGSVTDEVLRQATIPVLVHSPPCRIPRLISDPRFIRACILVPFDGSLTAVSCLAPAAELLGFSTPG